MELTGMSMCNIQLHFNEDVDFDFSSLPAECPSGSVSGSSYASSSFGPHTPTSGRSTPPFSSSFDFGSSFASSLDSVPFDITPPSSATSTYFPMTPEAAAVSDYAYRVFPATPSRGQTGFPGHPLSNCGTQLTPSQSMDGSFLINQLGPHPPSSTTPSVMTPFNHLSNVASHWAYPDSPINFSQHASTTLVDSVQFIKQEFEDDIMSPFTPSSTARKRALMGEARHRTTALQHVQQCPPPPNMRTMRIKRERKPRAVAAVTDDDDDDECRFAVDSIEPASTFKCPVEGCKAKPYRRNEHMKRHMKSVHGKALYSCDWCKHVANRMDNLEAHIKLHTLVRPKSGGKPRVDYYPGAVLQYEEMMKNNESRRRRNKKLKKRPN